MENWNLFFTNNCTVVGGAANNASDDKQVCAWRDASYTNGILDYFTQKKNCRQIQTDKRSHTLTSAIVTLPHVP